MNSSSHERSSARCGACLLRKRGIKGSSVRCSRLGCCFEALVIAALFVLLALLQNAYRWRQSPRCCRSLRPRRCDAVCSAVRSACCTRLGVVSVRWRWCGDRCGAMRCSCSLALACSALRRSLETRLAGLAAGKALATSHKKSACGQSLAGAAICKADRRTNFSERCHCAELKLKLVRDPQAKHTTSAILAAYPAWLWLAQCSLSRRRRAHGHPCAGQPPLRVSAPCPRLRRRTPTGGRAATRRAS